MSTMQYLLVFRFAAVFETAWLIWAAAAAGILLLSRVMVKRFAAWKQDSAIAQALKMWSIYSKNGGTLPDEQNRPRSLNGMERIYGPLIAEDFPELRLEALGALAENLLVKSYQALEAGSVPGLLSADYGGFYTESLERLIRQNRDQGRRAPQFSAVKIHKRVLSDYGQYHGRRVIEFQFAVEAMVQSEEHPEAQKRQMRNALRFQYMEDVLKFEAAGGSEKIISRSCPHCGAPLRGRGEEICPYCRSSIKAMEIYSWVPTELIAPGWSEAYLPSDPKAFA